MPQTVAHTGVCGILRRMAGEDRETLFARIDAALDRIEAAVAGGETSQAGLHHRHAALRSEVSQALRELDVLIEGQQG